ncbi:fasciclin domain-containing protein [Maribellus mangrovi]|uniref:fasciclin domain-containing protein n=1 Tax=Maribellus mangrovi TaxID=3133146 RepID=UPI0030EF9A65
MNLRIFALATILGNGLMTVSCDKPSDDYVPTVSEDMELKAGKALKKGDLSIAEIALIDDGEFEELVAALLYVYDSLGTGLVDMFLNGTDQYTVFAPTDAAFDSLYSTLGISAITDLDAELVLNVLLYHVTDRRSAAHSVVPKNNPRTIQTLLEEASFKVDNMGIIWAIGNTANIGTDEDDKPMINISASNGIIHVIDAVILPIEV